MSSTETLVLGGTGTSGRGVARLAVASGVPRLVLLAGRGEPEAEQAESPVAVGGRR